jgi:hypothetical protein
MGTRTVDWRLLATWGCLALLGGCTPAKFDRDSGSGGSGGLMEGSGGTTPGTGGDGLDMAADETPLADATDSGDMDSASADLAMDMGMDAETSGEVAPEVPIDAPMGIMPTVLGQVLISELLNDSSVLSDDFGEWFEVFNPSLDTNFDLNGCTLADSNNSAVITRSVVLMPGSFHTFALSMMAFNPDFVYAGVKLDNQLPDSITLACGNTMIDKFVYDPRMGVSGHSFSVDPTHLHAGENNVTGNFCVSNVPFHTVGGISDFGTPNQPNPPCPAGRF